jgi:hypothetical protein
MSKINSFDFSLQKRQVIEAFELYLKEKSSALSIFLANGTRQPSGTNNKYEWLESQLSPLAWTVNGAVTVGTLDVTTPANITFDSTSGLAVDDVIRFVADSTGVRVGNLQVRITSITNGTVAQGVIYGGTTDITIPDNAVAKFITNLVDENRKSFAGQNNWEPDTEYNYFQIFDQTIELSDTALNSLMYGNPSQIISQMKQAMYKIEQKMAEQMIYGRRVARGSSAKGSFAGLDFFLNQAGGNIKDASAGALTPAMINEIILEIRKDGGDVNTIMCNYEQARRISAFNTSGTNPMISRAETTAGSYVMQFVSDIPVAGGLVSSIVVDEKVPNNEIYMLNLGKIALVPFANRELTLVDATANGQDGKTQVLRGEYTLRVEDSKYSSGIIKNLAV